MNSRLQVVRTQHEGGSMGWSLTVSCPLHRDILELSSVSIVNGVSGTLCTLGVIATVQCRKPRAPVLHDLIATELHSSNKSVHHSANHRRWATVIMKDLKHQLTRVHESTPGIPSMGHTRPYRRYR